MQKVINPASLAASLENYWSPQVVGVVNDCYVKVARLKGELTWHSHEREDELFMILRGELLLETEGDSVLLRTGDVYIVPRGTLHNPVANEECLVMLFELKETSHTGNVTLDKTKTIAEQLAFYDDK